MSKKGGATSLQKDAPWRASPSVKPIPKIHHSPLLRLPQTPRSDYALSVMKVIFFVCIFLLGWFCSIMGFCWFLSFWVYLQHSNPIGNGLAMEAIVEAAGPECIVPGQITPIKLLGLKVLLFHQKAVFFFKFNVLWIWNLANL